jgi:ElaB/YqjD/DUF883 family membrane-anchored ribosome-binding protein
MKNAQALSHATSYARQSVSSAAGKLFEISEDFAARCRDSYHDAERGVRRLRIAAEESVDHTRRQIKAHPLATVALVGAGAFLIGGIVGRRNGRRGWR